VKITVLKIEKREGKMSKNIFTGLLFTVMISAVMVFAHTEAVAGTECSAEPQTFACFDFTNSGYRIERKQPFGQDIILNGNKAAKSYKWLVEKKKNGNAQHLYLALPAAVVVLGGSWNSLAAPGEGDNTTNTLVGDESKQLAKWTSSLNTITEIEVITDAKVGNPKAGGAYVKGTSITTENGGILMPAPATAQIIETTFIEITDSSGNVIRFQNNRDRTAIQVLKCTPPPGDAFFCNDLGNFVDITGEGIALGDFYGCFPPTEAHPANTNVFGTTPAHCGAGEFLTADADLRIDGTVICRFRYGQFYCN
jgi:hypothetical protein